MCTHSLGLALECQYRDLTLNPSNLQHGWGATRLQSIEPYKYMATHINDTLQYVFLYDIVEQRTPEATINCNFGRSCQIYNNNSIIFTISLGKLWL